MTELDILTEARRLVKKGWTQRAAARDKRGIEISAYGEKEPAQVCVYGAITRACRPYTENRTAREGALSIVRNMTPQLNIASWNDEDGRTQADAVHLLEEAIQEIVAIQGAT